MRSIGLYVNPERDKNFEYVTQVVSLLHQNGFTVFLHEHLDDFTLKDKVTVLEDDLFYQSVDVIVTLGGDGTILRVAAKAAEYGKPILGINLGHLGYLTQLERDDLTRLPDILNGELNCEDRCMLSVGIQFKDGAHKRYFVLNDAVIARQIVSNLIKIDLYANDEFVYSYRSDGIIFSTPTGSTGYSMSSGGPIADTNLQDIIIVNPVCEHSMLSKPLIFSAYDTLSCKVISAAENAYLSLDGKVSFCMSDIVNLTITKADKSLKLVQPDGNKFYKILNNKFSEGGV